MSNIRLTGAGGMIKLSVKAMLVPRWNDSLSRGAASPPLAGNGGSCDQALASINSRRKGQCLGYLASQARIHQYPPFGFTGITDRVLFSYCLDRKTAPI
jgi:hypothetical protein